MNPPMHPRKPFPLPRGGVIRVVAPSSPFEPSTFAQGVLELERLGYHVTYGRKLFEHDGYFAGTAIDRAADLCEAFADRDVHAIVCARGGFGAAELLPLLEDLPAEIFKNPKIFVGFSDATVLDNFLWRKAGWVTFYGPMVAAGFSAGANQSGGYDLSSFIRAVGSSQQNWAIDLRGQTLMPGEAEGAILGGCLTMLEATLGTPWECATNGSILLLEDRSMKPYQVERSLLHLGQAGKFDNIHGIVVGDFPECEPPAPSGVTVLDIFRRHFQEMRIPVVAGAAIGHTARAMLTLPLGVRGRLHAGNNALAATYGSTQLEILESACAEPAGGD
jgi:muramoyltetrapeptide carboxypeptidase